MTTYTYCKLTYYNTATYLFWIISFFLTSISLRLLHETLHGIFSVLTGGSFGTISILQWILFYPVFSISCSGGNPFLVIEGTLIAVWFISLFIVLFTSYPVLRLIMDDCTAANLSGKLFGVRLASVVEMFGTAVYALPNFMFYLGDGYVLGGDGTIMAMIFEQMGYSPQLQYVMAFMMLIGSFFALYYALKCDSLICSCRWGYP